MSSPLALATIPSFQGTQTQLDQVYKETRWTGSTALLPIIVSQLCLCPDSSSTQFNFKRSSHTQTLDQTTHNHATHQDSLRYPPRRFHRLRGSHSRRQVHDGGRPRVDNHRHEARLQQGQHRVHMDLWRRHTPRRRHSLHIRGQGRCQRLSGQRRPRHLRPLHRHVQLERTVWP